jgi:hypothetical protein
MSIPTAYNQSTAFQSAREVERGRYRDIQESDLVRLRVSPVSCELPFGHQTIQIILIGYSEVYLPDELVIAPASLLR